MKVKAALRKAPEMSNVKNLNMANVKNLHFKLLITRIIIFPQESASCLWRTWVKIKEVKNEPVVEPAAGLFEEKGLGNPILFAL